MAEDYFRAGGAASDEGAYADWSVQTADRVSLELGVTDDATCISLSWDDFAALHAEMGRTLSGRAR